MRLPARSLAQPNTLTLIHLNVGCCLVLHALPHLALHWLLITVVLSSANQRWTEGMLLI